MQERDNLHTPVLLHEVISSQKEIQGGVFIDCTFGAGGYTKALLSHGAGRVIGIDRDNTAVEIGWALQKEYPSFSIVKGLFSDVRKIADSFGLSEVDGIVMDIGVSSMQIDNPLRGFSFMQDGPLDMRMGNEGVSAADVVNTFSEKALSEIIFKYGQEKKSRSIAAKIVQRRSLKPFTSTLELAEVIGGVVKRSKDGLHPATRTFQALRIFVNDELQELEKGLQESSLLLAPSGRLSVVTFHSLEDGIVKQFMRSKTGYSVGVSRYVPVSEKPKETSFALVYKKPITPSEEEKKINPRSRSAKLRVMERRTQI